MSSIIAVINQKGGVGKTTSVINLATSLSILGQNNLIIDLDPQGNATTGLGISINERNRNIYKLLIDQISLDEAIQKTKINDLDIISSTVDLSGLELETASDNSRAFLLKKIFNNNKNIISKYDHIFIDCPPALGLLTINGLVASKSVIIPLQCEFFALEGLSALTNTISTIKSGLNSNIDLEGVVLTMFDKRNALSSLVEEDVRSHFKNKVYKTVIPRNVRISEAPSHGKPVLLYDTQCAGSQAYIGLAKEVILNQ